MDSVLRDMNRERSKMQSDIDNLNRHYENLHGYVQQYIRQTTVEWAKLVVDHPKTLLLVVETTRIVDERGYATSGENEPIRFTVKPLASGEIWDQLLSPHYSKAVQGTDYHGLTMADLVNKPRLVDAWPKIAEMLQDHHVIIFGADWSRKALQTVGYPFVLDSAFCLHNKCKEYYGEYYDLSLEKVLTYQGIDKKRDELKNSRDRIVMLESLIHNLAKGMTKQFPRQETNNLESDFLGLVGADGEDLSDLDAHPF
jgi:DNA polymerase III epsilon subunit-like protein